MGYLFFGYIIGRLNLSRIADVFEQTPPESFQEIKIDVVGVPEVVAGADEVEKQILNGVFDQIVVGREFPAIAKQLIDIVVINVRKGIFLALFEIFPQFVVARFLPHFPEISPSKVELLAEKQIISVPGKLLTTNDQTIRIYICFRY
jgi:hypothetical protein